MRILGLGRLRKKTGMVKEEIRNTWPEQIELTLASKEERKLAKRCIQWYDKVFQAEHDLQLHSLCSWLYELARAFTEFYDKHYVIEKRDGKETLHKDRLLLCEITASCMERAFSILGFLSVDKM